MAVVADLELPHFDGFDQTLRGPLFHEAMHELERTGSWLARTPLGYLVLDRESGEWFLRSKATVFPGLTIAQLFGVTDGPLHEEIVRNIININGDHHRRLRNLLNPALAPRAAERHREGMRQILERLYAELPSDGRCDFVSAFAKPYPSRVIARLVGEPLEMAPKLDEWSNWIQRQFDTASLATEREEIEKRVVEFYDYADVMLARRRENPGDDLVSMLIAVEQDGDRLSDVELVNLVLDVILGGIDTAQSQLSHLVRLLAEHPDQWEALRADPNRLAPAAVEEVLRYEPVTPFAARITTEDVEHRGVTFPAGTVIAISAWHANRDVDGPDPSAFDITAQRARARPLTFGAGIHYCVGANLARAELQEAIAFLAERVERIELDGEPEFGTITGIYGMEALPLRLAPASR